MPGFAEPCRELRVQLANGTIVTSTATMTLQLDFGALSKTQGKWEGGLGVLCHVLPSLEHDVVLGMDFLAKYNPSVDFAAREMILPTG